MRRVVVGSFSEWLRAQRRRDDPVGDLARDAMADDGWLGGRDLSALHGHLSRYGACEGAHDALDRAWREWREE
jgi:hypothetical protein